MENTQYQDFLDLGVVIGQNQAFSAVAGRCTAAQAATLLRIREERNYRMLEPSWEDFCRKHLKISRSEADRLISLFQEFGTGYFEVAQFARVSAETYRSLAPAVKDGVLYLDGDAIEINSENAQKVAAAVAQLRRKASERKTANPPDVHKRLLSLDRRVSSLVAEFAELSRHERGGDHWLELAATVDRARRELAQIAV